MKLVIADGSELSRMALNAVFSTCPEVDVQCTVSNYLELDKCLSQGTPDVILLDYTSKGFDIKSVNDIRKKAKDTQILAITPDPNAITIQHAISAGINGYVKKSCSIDEIKEAVESCHHGQPFFCGEIIRLLEESGIPVDKLSEGKENCDAVLISTRELEIIRLIAQGYSNPKIADQLCLSNHTVNAHKKNIFNKLGVNNTTSVVMYAVKNKIIDPNEFLFSSDLN